MKTWQKFLIVSVSLFYTLSTPINVGACGFSVDNRQIRFWLFQSDVDQLEALRPFILDYDHLYFGEASWWRYDLPDSLQSIYQQSDPALADIRWQNVRQWKRETGVNLPLWKIYQAQYYLQNTDTNFVKNDFIKALRGLSDKSYYHYFALAKKAEKANDNTYLWEAKTPQQSLNDEIKKQMVVGMKQTKNTFIKQRYAYQVMRFAHYTQDHSLMDAVYQQHFENTSDSWLKNGALFYKTAPVGMNDPKTDAHSLKHYLHLFDKLSDKRTLIVKKLPRKTMLKYADEVDNPKEKSLARLMATLKEPARSLPHIKEVYENYPQNRFLPMLFSREINKIEDWLWTTELTGFQSVEIAQERNDDGYGSWENWTNRVRNRTSDVAYLQELHDLAEKIISDKKQRDIDFYRLIAAHSDFLLGNFEGAKSHITQVSNQLSLSRNLQKDILTILLHFENPKLSFQEKEDVLFRFMQKKSFYIKNVFNVATQIDNLIVYIGKKYRNNNQLVKWLLLQSKTNSLTTSQGDSYSYYNTYRGDNFWVNLSENGKEEDVLSLLRLYDKKSKSSFEKYLLEGTYLNRGDILEMLAQFRIRNNNFEGAYRAVKDLSISNLYKQSFSDPYRAYKEQDSLNLVAGLSMNPFKVNTSGKNKNKKWNLSLKDFIGQHLKYQREIEQNTAIDKGRNYFKLANAAFNLTYYGNAWQIQKPWWSSGEFKDSMPPDIAQQYYGTYKAKGLYLLAVKYAKDSKIKQSAAFMASYCDELFTRYQDKTAPTMGYVMQNGDEQIRDFESYRSLLGKDTYYFDKWAKDCSGLDDFMQKL